MAYKEKYFSLKGGLDLVSPQIDIDPGKLIASSNYEAARSGKGYTRVQGVERFDGHPSPSEQVYYLQKFKQGASAPGLPDVGRTVIGATSGATAIIEVYFVVAGLFDLGTAVGHIIIRELEGVFEDGEIIQVAQPVAYTQGFSGGYN